jgi:hypothetical protein
MIGLLTVTELKTKTELCGDCGSMMHEIRGSLLICECFGRHTAEQNVVGLVIRAQLGVMREPIFRKAA